jgi:hypothetical protein
MIPKVSRNGRSFKGIFAYCMHDEKATTSDRVAWSKAINVHDLGKETWRLMAHTVHTAEILKRENGASTSGRKLECPVFSYALSWAPDQRPSQQHMEETAVRSLKRLGLDEQEAMLVCHTDTAHPHLHVIVNRVHPLTGYAASVDCSAKKLQRFASDYERETKLYCHQREENRLRAEQDRPSELEVLQKLWDSQLAGEEFVTALARRGFQLLEGRKRPLLQSPCGQLFNPVRLLEGVKAKDFRDRIKNLSFKNWQDVDLISSSPQTSAPRTTCFAPSESSI